MSKITAEALAALDPEVRTQVENDIALGQRARNLLDKLWSDPKEGLAFKRKAKAIMPELRIPDIEAIDSVAPVIEAQIGEVQTGLNKLIERLDKQDTTAKEARETADFEAACAAARKEYQLTDDGWNKVIERMKATNNPDPAAAAAWVTDHMPRQKPVGGSGFGPQKLNLFGAGKIDEDWKDLHTDPNAWFDKTVAGILDEFNQAA